MFLNVISESDIFQVTISGGCTVADLKQYLACLSGCPSEKQILYTGTSVMDDDKPLSDYGLADEAVISMDVETISTNCGLLASSLVNNGCALS